MARISTNVIEECVIFLKKKMERDSIDSGVDSMKNLS